ncbi:UNVERIFIED_CONTAM: hypothetical protein PYX00_000017 [Menopon gallinae]|uniref:DUF4773 domain-containing protein n=1 Tax=Menopon gallinae TaxID=328185 RepID=A0AAW2I6V7_9NEOP
MRTLRRQTHVTRQPCTCNSQAESCTCCGRVDQASTNFSARGCGTVRYGARRRNRNLRYEVSVNNRTVGTRTEVAGRNPDQICHPFPRHPYFDVCWRFHTTSFDENGQLHFCTSVDGRFGGYTFYTMHFECVTHDTNSNTDASGTRKKE